MNRNNEHDNTTHTTSHDHTQKASVDPHMRAGRRQAAVGTMEGLGEVPVLVCLTWLGTRLQEPSHKSGETRRVKGRGKEHAQRPSFTMGHKQRKTHKTSKYTGKRGRDYGGDETEGGQRGQGQWPHKLSCQCCCCAACRCRAGGDRARHQFPVFSQPELL